MRKAQLWLLVALVSLTFASTALAEKKDARAPQAIVLDATAKAAPAWPTVAVNQDAKPRPDLEAPVSIRYPTERCLNPCVGGSGCGAWEVHWEAYCRTTGYYSKDCTGAAGRYCARMQYSELIDASTGTNVSECLTCLY